MYTARFAGKTRNPVRDRDVDELTGELLQWRPELPGDRLLLPEPWLASLYGAEDDLAPAGGKIEPKTVPWIGYTSERPPVDPRTLITSPLPPAPAAPGAAPAHPVAAAVRWPRVMLSPVTDEEAAVLLAGTGAGAPAPVCFDGLVLAGPADLEGLLARRPDLARPRGRRPAWVLLPFHPEDTPGAWARDWVRVEAWSPAALPPVLIPAGVAGGDVQVPVDRLWRARLALLRALEEPVPVPVVWPWAGPRRPGGAGGDTDRDGRVAGRERTAASGTAGATHPEMEAFIAHRAEQQAPVWWIVWGGGTPAS